MICARAEECKNEKPEGVKEIRLNVEWVTLDLSGRSISFSWCVQ